eukprot:g5425.t1
MTKHIGYSSMFKQSLGQCEFSPDGSMLAMAQMHRCVIRDPTSLEIIALFTCADTITQIEWSSDSKLMLCKVSKRQLVQLFNVEDPEWQCRITEGVAGLNYARWAPDGRHVLTMSSFNLHLTVWSLGSDDAVYIKHPKSLKKAVSFSPGGEYMAVATRRECKDFVEIYITSEYNTTLNSSRQFASANASNSGEAWSLVNKFSVPTHDLSQLSWSPDGRHLLVVDSPLQYLVLVYTPDGTLHREYKAYENALGVKSAAWAPSGKFLALGSFDEHMRMLNHLNWRAFGEYAHIPRLHDPAGMRKSTRPVEGSAVIVYREEAVKEMTEIALSKNDDGYKTTKGSRNSNGNLNESPHLEIVHSKTRYRPDSSVTPLRTVRALPGKVPTKGSAKSLNQLANGPRMGVGMLEWSSCGRFVATRNDNMPNAVWIWDMARLRLASVLEHQISVRGFAWNPTRPQLAICTSAPKIFFWTSEKASWGEVPLARETSLSFHVIGCRWSPSGNALLLLSKSHMVSMYFDEDDNEIENEVGENSCEINVN